MLVYEFVENGNLEQWLHGDVGPVSPLTWEARLNIAIGTAKGFVFLYCFSYTLALALGSCVAIRTIDHRSC